MKQSRISTEKGFTIVENMLAVAVLAISVLALGQLMSVAVRQNAFTRVETMSTAIAQEKLEGLILENISQLVLQEEHLHEMVRLTNQELGKSLGHLVERLQTLDSLTGDLDRRLGHLYDVLETGQLLALAWPG